MKILVVGAAGKIGQWLVKLALEQGHEVTAFARDPSKVEARGERLRLERGDALDPAAVDRAVRGQDAVVSALGTLDRKSKVRSEGTGLVVEAMKRHGVRRFAVVSAIGVGDSREQARRSSFVFGRIILPLFLEKPFADMARMEEIVKDSGLEWVIVRPTGLVDRPASGKVRAVVDGSSVGTAIPRADVAAFMLEEVSGPGAYIGRLPSIWAA